jgi:hypothetical protein
VLPEHAGNGRLMCVMPRQLMVDYSKFRLCSLENVLVHLRRMDALNRVKSVHTKMKREGEVEDETEKETS